MDRFAAFKRGNPIHGTAENLLALLLESAPREQLCAWLRLPLEHAAAKGNGDLVMMVLAAGEDAFVRRHRDDTVLDRYPLVAAAQGSVRGAVASALLVICSAPTGEERKSVFLGDDRADATVATGEGGGSACAASETRRSNRSRGSSSNGDSVGGGGSSSSSSSNNNNSGSSSNSSSSNSSSGSSATSDSSNTDSKANSDSDSDSNNNSSHRTPLHFAASGGHVSAVKALIQAGIDMDIVDEEGCSALHLAVFRGFDKVVEELVSAGANVGTSDSEGETPLHTACGHGSLAMVRSLLRDSKGGEALSAKGNEGVHLEMSPLHRAALGGHCQVMLELLDHGASLDSLTGNARTPLHAAAMSGSADAVRFLLDRNPSSLEAKDQEGRTALHLASGHRLGSDGTLTALLKAGADMESKTALGETSLHKACKALRVSAVRILLRRGADEAAVDADGRSPSAMVSQLLQSQRPGVFRDMLKTILRVLASAPVDRVWRRRGWLLMVRSSYRRGEGFHFTEGGGGDCKRSSSLLEGFQHTEGGGGNCGRSSCLREGFYRAEGGGTGGSGDSGGIAARKRARGPPRKFAVGTVDLSEVARNGDNRRGRKVDREDTAAVLLHPLVNCTARENSDRKIWCRARTRRIALGSESVLEGACGEVVRQGGGESGDGKVRAVVERAVGVEEDGIFRSIVAFL